MNSARAVLFWFVLCAIAIAPIGAARTTEAAADLIEQADAAFDRWSQPFGFFEYRDRLETAVSLWEQALALIPEEDLANHAHLLNRLAQAYFELAEAYLVTSFEREEAYGKGKDYALASLRLDPAFRATWEADGPRAALSSANDVAAIFWYGNALGMWLNYHMLTAITGGVRDVLACYERALELDETYMGGGPHRSLAALIAQAHFFIGRSRHDAIRHYERSIEIDPAYLESYVNYAEHYAGPTQQLALRDELLATLMQLAQDPEIVASWPLYNELAIRRAEAMLQ